jgi:hypothetical protein
MNRKRKMDIVERLRASLSYDTPARYPEMVTEAADEIVRLRAALGAISLMKGEDLYYADGHDHDNAAAAYASSVLSRPKQP